MKRDQEVILKLEWACTVAGVRFGGIQSCYGIREDQMLFQPFTGGTTLALPLSEVSVLSISQKIAGARNAA
jgi:hypothetical protein